MFNNKFQVSNFKLQEGVSLYLALVTMTIILAVALGLTTIFLAQFRQIREMGDSVVALYAADTGIERGLKEAESDSSWDGSRRNGSLVDIGAIYQYQKENPGGDCNADAYCISASGYYKNTVRAIRVTR